MDSPINLSTPIPEGSTIDFLCYSKYVSVPWILVAQKFHRFTDKKYEDSVRPVSFSYETMVKFHRALTTKERPEMNDEDAKLLNWLVLRDFADAYKLYRVASPVLAEVPTVASSSNELPQEEMRDFIVMREIAPPPPKPVEVPRPAVAPSNQLSWGERRGLVSK